MRTILIILLVTSYLAKGQEKLYAIRQNTNGTKDSMMRKDFTDSVFNKSNGQFVCFIREHYLQFYDPNFPIGFENFTQRADGIWINQNMITDGATAIPSIIQTAIDTKLATNGNGSALTGITTAQITASTNKNFVTDVQATVLSNTSGTNTGDQTSVSGNAGTATALQNPRTINGTSFDGTANITVTAAAGTLTGTTLNSSVVTSSLTSVGTIGTGTWQGSVISSTFGGTGVNNGGRTLAINTNSGTVAFSAASKTFTVANTLTISGTDGSTLNVGAGGTLGSNAFNSTSYQPLNTNLTSIGALANGNGFLKNNGSGGFTYESPAGSGTVTDVSVVTANGISGSVATSTSTPAITLTLGDISPTTVNGVTITNLLPKTTTSGVGSSPTANGTQTITHNLGRVPSVIRIYGYGTFTSNAAATATTSSIGIFSSSGNFCVYQRYGTSITTTQAGLSSSTFAILLATGGGNFISGVIQNVDGDSFDIVWTETGAATAQVYLWEAQ